jgi:predicted ester cyclase
MGVTEQSRVATSVVTGQFIEALEHLYGQGDLGGIENLFAPDYVEHDPGSPGPRRGPECVKQFIELYRCTFPGLELTIAERAVEGDTVILHWTGLGTHAGSLQDLAPTGREVRITGITITRIDRGKAVEGWSDWHSAALLRQLNVWPQSIQWRTPPK